MYCVEVQIYGSLVKHATPTMDLFRRDKSNFKTKKARQQAVISGKKKGVFSLPWITFFNDLKPHCTTRCSFCCISSAFTFARGVQHCFDRAISFCGTNTHLTQWIWCLHHCQAKAQFTQDVEADLCVNLRDETLILFVCCVNTRTGRNSSLFCVNGT